MLEFSSRIPSDDEQSRWMSTDTGSSLGATTSTWSVGNLTPGLLLFFYFCAIVIATGHLVWFQKLDGTLSDEYFIPQTYVITVSNIVASAWSICLATSLSIAFTQCLWNVMRNRFLPISTIENFYGVMHNVFLLRPRVFRVAPLLYFIAAIVWIISFIKTLPAGALIAVPRETTNSVDTTITVYNSSFYGNGTPAELAYLPGGINFRVGSDNSSLDIGSGGLSYLSKKRRLYQSLFSTRELGIFPPLCEGNCSFPMKFKGPYLDCTSSTSNVNISLSPGREGALAFDRYTGEYNLTTLHLRQVLPIFELDPDNSGTIPNFIQTTTTGADALDLTCQLGIGNYDAEISYDNGVRHISHTVQPLRDVTYPSGCEVDRLSSWSAIATVCRNITQFKEPTAIEELDPFADTLVPFSSIAKETLEDYSIYMLYQFLGYYLNGTFQGICYPTGTSDLDKSIPVELNRTVVNCEFDEDIPSKPPILDSFFYDPNYAISTRENSELPDITITQEILNDVLFNITMTFASTPPYRWNETIATNVTTWPLTYSFKKPLNLILPYYLPILVSAPIIIYAIIVLYFKHNVSAMSNSFIQILMTTGGSQAIANAAAGGCLGGEHNVPEKLKNLKIRYGDITSATESDHGHVLRRAGFGVEGEVSPLRRDALYGAYD